MNGPQLHQVAPFKIDRDDAQMVTRAYFGCENCRKLWRVIVNYGDAAIAEITKRRMRMRVEAIEMEKSSGTFVVVRSDANKEDARCGARTNRSRP